MEDILRPATQEEIDAELAARTKSKSTENITIVAMARYIDMEMKSNKVYGIIETDDKKVFVFWGGYHKALKVKKYRNISDAFNQFWTKTNKGYVEQSPEQIRRNTDWVIEALDAEFAKN